MFEHDSYSSFCGGSFGWTSIILNFIHLYTLSDRAGMGNSTWVISPLGIPTTHLTAQGEALGTNFQVMQMDSVTLGNCQLPWPSWRSSTGAPCSVFGTPMRNYKVLIAGHFKGTTMVNNSLLRVCKPWKFDY